MPDSEEPKIIVDHDWKSQVEKEKADLKQQEQPKESPTDASKDFELPPASISVLISTLATQAMGCLGMFPDPGTGKVHVDRSMAKHFIDTIGVLDEKTKGNLSEQEDALLKDTLHQLRMAFVASGKANSATSEGGEEPDERKSSIELP